MEAVSRGAREAGGRAIGLTTPFYRLAPNGYLDEVIEIERWQDRLFALVERGDGYVILKGGTGTMLELAAVWECLNKRAIAPRPCVALGFWAPVVECVREAERERNGRRWEEFGAGLIHLASGPAEAVEYLTRGLR
jgi:predicted Rossmann-fold nucleotide-binding protein